MVTIPTARFVVTCPAGCDADFQPTDVALPEGRLLACRACGHLISQIGEADYLAALAKFDTEAGTLPDDASWKRHDQRARRLFSRLRKLLDVPPDGSFRLLDVGCSSGALLLSAKRDGIKAEGVEPAVKAAESARAAGLAVFSGTLQDAGYPAERFQAVTMMEVIEHLPRPVDVVREIWNVLAPGGLLAIGTGNADSWTVSVMRERWDYFHVGRYGGAHQFFHAAFAGTVGGSLRVPDRTAGDAPRAVCRVLSDVSRIVPFVENCSRGVEFAGHVVPQRP